MATGGPNELLDATRAYLLARREPELIDFLEGLDWAMRPRRLEANTLACARHVARAVEIAPAGEGALAGVLRDALSRLRWGQTYTAADFGAAFVDGYGWIELFGTRGHFANDRVAGGFLLLGPNLTYPDHHHVAREIYVPLTGGTLWKMGAQPFRERAAGELIVHESDAPHAMTTGAQPLLALYLWRGGDLAQRSTIGAEFGARMRTSRSPRTSGRSPASAFRSRRG